MVLTATVALPAGLNAVILTWLTSSMALGSRRPLAVARALGASRPQLATALAIAQLLPALPAAILGIPAGIALFASLKRTGFVVPSTPSLVLVVLAVLTAITGLALRTARLGLRRTAAAALAAEAPPPG